MANNLNANISHSKMDANNQAVDQEPIPKVFVDHIRKSNIWARRMIQHLQHLKISMRTAGHSTNSNFMVAPRRGRWKCFGDIIGSRSTAIRILGIFELLMVNLDARMAFVQSI